MRTIILILLVLLLLGAFPIGGNGGWHGAGYAPVGGLGLVLLVVLILILLGVV